MALATVSTGGVINAIDPNQYYNLLTGVMTDQPVAVSNRIRAQMTGAASGTGGYAGETASGPPASGTFVAGDFIVDANGIMWTCYVGGTPGTWRTQPMLVGAKYSTGGTLCTSTGGASEVAMTAWTGGDATITFTNGFLYEVRLSVGAYDAGTAGVGGTVVAKCRRTVNSTSAAIVGQWQLPTAGGTAVKSATATSLVKNASGADISASMGLTVTQLVGGNGSLYGDASLPAYLTVWLLGTSAVLTAEAAMAWAIT